MTPTPGRILFVDDDPNVLSGLQRSLRRSFDFDTAGNGQEALALLENRGPYAVIVADMSMPVMDGAELLQSVAHSWPDTVRIMLTGNADQRSAVEAVNRGNVFRFLTKPCPTETLTAALETALKHHELIVTEKALLNQTLNGSVQILTDILAMLDPEAFGHAQLRRAAARVAARRLGLASTWDIEIAALLADVGRVTLPAPLREKLRAHQPLSPGERDLAERVPEFSARLLGNVPRLETVAKIVLYHKKNYNGTGFPADDISGAAIPLGARILRVVDTAVTMLRGGVPLPEVLIAMQAGPERYEPAVVRTLLAPGSVLQTTAAPSGRAGKQLPLGELAEGHVLRSDVVTRDGKVILGAGLALSAAQLQHLRNCAVLHPLVEPIAVESPLERP